jgi:hypothetical protein
MIKKIFNIIIITTLFVFLVMVSSATKPAKVDEPEKVDTLLYHTIYFQDSLLFAAFNSCDFEKFKSFFSPDLEIYQDNTGVRDYNQSMEAFRGLFQGDYILTRQLIRESLEVYPIKDFGAIETGQHTFCHVENEKPDCGTFKFVHIWKYQDGNWKITRIITYNH